MLKSKQNKIRSWEYGNSGFAKDELGPYQDAILDFNEAIMLDPQYAEAFYNRGGRAKQELEQLAEARADFRQAARLDPQYNNIEDPHRIDNQPVEPIQDVEHEIPPEQAIDQPMSTARALTTVGHFQTEHRVTSQPTKNKSKTDDIQIPNDGTFNLKSLAVKMGG